jgi:hypothetical protein
LSFAFGITEKEYLVITETLTGEVSAKTGNSVNHASREYFMAPKANLMAILFDNKMELAYIHNEKQGNLSRISIYQV